MIFLFAVPGSEKFTQGHSQKQEKSGGRGRWSRVQLFCRKRTPELLTVPDSSGVCCICLQLSPLLLVIAGHKFVYIWLKQKHFLACFRAGRKLPQTCTGKTTTWMCIDVAVRPEHVTAGRHAGSSFLIVRYITTVHQNANCHVEQKEQK